MVAACRGGRLRGEPGRAVSPARGAHPGALLPANLKLSQVTEARVEAFRDAALLAHNRPMVRKVFGALKAVLKRAKRAHVAAGVTIGQ